MTKNALLFLCLSCGLLLSPTCLLADEETPTEANTAQTQRQPQVPLQELRLFVEVFEHIRKAYVEEIDDETMLKNAIVGLLDGLDPHSVYLDRESYDNLQESAKGTFGGLGLEVGMEDGYVKVVSPIDDTPAQQAGLQPGDLIIKLDDQLVRGLSLQEAIELMRGPEGTSITLTISRQGIDKPFDITIVRALIQVRSVRSRILEPGFAYIRVAQFQEKTGQQFRNTLKKLSKENPDLKGVVLDLRNNPGGLLTASIEVVDSVLDEGLIVYTEGRLPGSDNRYLAKQGDLLNGLPVAVLINGGSASAAEIVSGALQDHHRAIILGTESFGKGSVQTVLPLGENRAVKLTTARYFTPGGRSIQAEGIEPDIHVAPAEVNYINQENLIKESNLSGHLRNGKGKTGSSTAGNRQIDDNQLQEALNLLKGVSILKKTAKKTKK